MLIHVEDREPKHDAATKGLGLTQQERMKYAGSAMHALIIVDGCRDVELQPGGGARANEEMVAAGVRVTSSSARAFDQ